MLDLRDIKIAIIFYAPAPTTALVRGIMFSGCLSHCRESDISGTPGGNFLHRGPFGLKDELIRFWWLNVKGQGPVTSKTFFFLALTQEFT